VKRISSTEEFQEANLHLAAILVVDQHVLVVVFAIRLLERTSDLDVRLLLIESVPDRHITLLRVSAGRAQTRKSILYCLNGLCPLDEARLAANLFALLAHEIVLDWNLVLLATDATHSVDSLDGPLGFAVDD
jgi:hypothetical protein